MAKEDFCFTFYDGDAARDERWYCIQDSARFNKDIPIASGIYCFIEYNYRSKRKRVIYVGKSQDLSIRLKPGHKAERIYKSSNKKLHTVLVLKIMLTKDFHEKEIKYIKRLKPFYNVISNPVIKRKIIYTNGKKIY